MMLDADSRFVAGLLPCDAVTETLTVSKIDGMLRKVDRRITVITNHMRSIRQSLLAAPTKPLTGLTLRAEAPILHVRLVFKLTGLEAALDANVAHRNQLVKARSLAREAA